MELYAINFGAAFIAFALGWFLGRRTSRFMLVGFLLALGCISAVSLHQVSASGLYGWQFYSPENSWPMGIGLALIPACLALAGPAAFGKEGPAAIVSSVLVLAYAATPVPSILAACVCFAACV